MNEIKKCEFTKIKFFAFFLLFQLINYGNCNKAIKVLSRSYSAVFFIMRFRVELKRGKFILLAQIIFVIFDCL